MNISPLDATGYSMFVVGITSLIGSVNYARKNLIDSRAAVMFALPSFISVWVMRVYILPSIPENIISINSFTLKKEVFVMLLFAVLMIIVGLNMMRKNKLAEKEKTQTEKKPDVFSIILLGFNVGALTGFVGVGGGFIIVPALVLFAKIPVKISVGTSLIVIAANSFVGFIGSISAGHIQNWKFLFIFSAFSVAGILLGMRLVKNIPGSKVKMMFGWFVLCMGTAIALRELFL